MVFARPFPNSITATFITIVTMTLWLLSANPVEAQTCSFSTTGLDFGSVDVSAGKLIRTSGSLSANCTGKRRGVIRVCANYGAGSGGVSAGGDPRHMTNAGNSLDYNIYKNPSGHDVWGSSFWPYPQGPKTFTMELGGNGASSVTTAIRGIIQSNQTGAGPGIYTSNFSGSEALISYAYDNVGDCSVISALGGTPMPFTVHANVLSACTVVTSNMNFGTAGVLTSNLDTTNNISVTCANLTPFTIGLSGGLSGTSDPTLRQMVNGGSVVTYGIYQDAARTIGWGDAVGTDTMTATGDGTTQVFPAYGRVPPQATPAAGTYTDTVIVTVTY